jgi:hypothetical protein
MTSPARVVDAIIRSTRSGNLVPGRPAAWQLTKR